MPRVKCVDMNILKRMVRHQPVSATEEICFSDPNPWTLSASGTLSRFLRALPILFPESSVAYFERTGEGLLSEYLQQLSVPASVRIARGAIWSRPHCHHVPLTRDNMEAIAAFLESNPVDYFCDHLHVYRGSKVLLEWYDAFEG